MPSENRKQTPYGVMPTKTSKPPVSMTQENKLGPATGTTCHMLPNQGITGKTGGALDASKEILQNLFRVLDSELSPTPAAP